MSNWETLFEVLKSSLFAPLCVAGLVAWIFSDCIMYKVWHAADAKMKENARRAEREARERGD